MKDIKNMCTNNNFNYQLVNKGIGEIYREWLNQTVI